MWLEERERDVMSDLAGHLHMLWFAEEKTQKLNKQQ